MMPSTCLRRSRRSLRRSIRRVDKPEMTGLQHEFNDIATAEALNLCGLVVCDDETIRKRKEELYRVLTVELRSGRLQNELPDFCPGLQRACVELCTELGIANDFDSSLHTVSKPLAKPKLRLLSKLLRLRKKLPKASSTENIPLI